MSQFHQNFIIRLIDLYGLELDDHQVDIPIVTWLQKYDSAWIVKAIVESLYRGRYKIKSVDNILKDWQRLGKPRYNFTPDYERGILQNVPEPSDLAATPMLLSSSVPVVSGVSLERPHSSSQSSMNQPPLVGSENLDPEESAPFGRHLRSNTAQLAIHPVEDSALVAANLEHLPSIASEPDRAEVVVSLPHQFQDDSVRVASALPHRCDLDAPADRSNSQPVNRHLFATLKAIVDPHHQRDTNIDRSVSLPLYVVNSHPHQIKQFKLPIENISEEQYR